MSPRAMTRWALLLALMFPASALSAHKPFSAMTLSERLHFQQRVIAQDHHTIRWWLDHRDRWPARRYLTTHRRKPVWHGREPYPLWWAQQQLRWTTREIAETKRLLSPVPALPWAFWNCVASGWTGGAPGAGSRVSVGEGGVTSYNPSGYYGRYQMDWGFMRSHGADMLAKYGGRDARSWTLLDQTIVAERGFASQGAGAWPNTAPPCLFLRE